MQNPSQEPPAPRKALNQDSKDMDVPCTFKIKIETKILNMGVSKTNDHIELMIKIPNPSQEPPTSSKAPYEDFEDTNVLCIFIIKIESQNLNHGCTKVQDHIQIKIKMPNSSQEPPKSSKNPNQDFKDTGVLCTLK